MTLNIIDTVHGNWWVSCTATHVMQRCTQSRTKFVVFSSSFIRYFIGRLVNLNSCVDYKNIRLPCDFIVWQLQLGQEDGAVLCPPAVNDGDDLVPPTHRPHQSQIFYWSLNRLKNRENFAFKNNEPPSLIFLAHLQRKTKELQSIVMLKGNKMPIIFMMVYF